MINIQSPTFSSSSKIDLASKLSPCFRNKRVPSSQDNYTCHWNRVNSCKKLDSPSKISQKNRKRSHNSQQRVKTKINFSHNIVEQLITLKNQYTTLKIAYQDLIQTKIKNEEQFIKNNQEIKRLTQQRQKFIKENQKYRNKIVFLQSEVQRIKRQSLKLIQIQQFKARKLQQNLVQKQKAISTLKQSFKIDQNLNMSAILLPTTESDQLKNLPRQITNNQIYQLDSLMFSHDRTLSNSQFISVSLTSMMQSQNTKRNNTSYTSNTNAPIVMPVHINNFNTNVQKCTDKIINVVDKQNKENQEKILDNFKKFRKQITKKIQVNLQDRHKDITVQQVGLAKNPMDRKNSKSNKASKSKLKKDDDSIQNRSSKKKIMNK